MSRFIIVVDSGTKVQRDAITRMLQAKPWGTWHYFEDLWVVASNPGGPTPEQIAKEIEALSPEIKNLTKVVFEVKDGVKSPYWGRAPKGAWEWMKKYWGDP